MQVVIGEGAEAVNLWFRIDDHVTRFDELKRIEEEKNEIEKIRLMNQIVSNRVLKVENLFDIDENGNEYEVTAQHIRDGKIPSYLLTLITKAFNAENSGQKEKNLVTSA